MEKFVKVKIFFKSILICAVFFAICGVIYFLGNELKEINKQSKNLMSPIVYPIVYIASGSEMLISDNETAKVYGSDNCPYQLELNHCVKLTGESVLVTLVTNNKQWSENWILKNENKRFSLIRPNGFIVRQKINE